MIAEELVDQIRDDDVAHVYIDMSGNGGPYLPVDSVRYYDNGPNGVRAFIIAPLRTDAHDAVRRQMAAICGERLRRAIEFLAEIEAELT
jgi:hypothetical protein